MGDSRGMLKPGGGAMTLVERERGEELARVSSNTVFDVRSCMCAS